MDIGRKRTSEEIRKNGIQERVGRVQENAESYCEETQSFSRKEDLEILEKLYEALKPFNWGS